MVIWVRKIFDFRKQSPNSPWNVLLQLFSNLLRNPSVLRNGSYVRPIRRYVYIL